MIKLFREKRLDFCNKLSKENTSHTQSYRTATTEIENANYLTLQVKGGSFSRIIAKFYKLQFSKFKFFNSNLISF